MVADPYQRNFPAVSQSELYAVYVLGLVFVAVAAIAMPAAWADASTQSSAKPVCQTPKGQGIDAADAVAVVTRDPPVQRNPDATLQYDYCLRSTGKEHRFQITDFDEPFGEITELRLRGSYLAYTGQTNASSSGDYTGYVTRVINVQTGNVQTVPASLPGFNFPSDVDDFVLSASGMVVGLAQPFVPSDVTAPEPVYVVAFNASTSQRTIVTSVPGPYANLQIFDCSAGCSPTTTAMVGWTSNAGPEQYASLSASG